MCSEVQRAKSTNAFQDEHLCDGLNAVIDGPVYGVQDIWGAASSTENWGFLLLT